MSHSHDNPDLAHHFDTPEQQFEAGKLGMWLFLVTELLMFGGLFVLYAYLRANYFEIFEYAHHYLDWKLGALNTAILLASSWTMALAVRAASKGAQKQLLWLLVLTFFGGIGFFSVKSVEYGKKFAHGITPGSSSIFFPVTGDVKSTMKIDFNPYSFGPDESGYSHYHEALTDAEGHPVTVAVSDAAFWESRFGVTPEQLQQELIHQLEVMHHEEVHGVHSDGHGGHGEHGAHSDDHHDVHDQGEIVYAPALVESGHDTNRSSVSAPGTSAAGMRADIEEGGDEAVEFGVHNFSTHHEQKHFSDLKPETQKRVFQFFQVYYVMTGLHGLHVGIGMAVILWLIILAAKKRFHAKYYDPVDVGGLYWHLVDLIWIFLFPLLYLIH